MAKRSERIRADRAIDKTQAEIVRLIFREFAAGLTARAIAQRLNDEGIPRPDDSSPTDSIQLRNAQ